MKRIELKRTLLLTLLLAGVTFFSASGQDATASASKNVYTTSGGELIFSWANAKINGLDATTITRFSPVFNIQTQVHMDMSSHVGFFSGISIRNVGFIWDDPAAANTRYKARNYTLGIPIALKVGNMTGYNLFGGYEIEFPFAYKEKKFVNEEKVDKNDSWFSNKTPGMYNTVFVGIQTPYGTQIKFKYYLTNFFNKDYAANDGSGGITYPYKDFNANVFYVSLSFQVLKGSKFYYKHQ